MFFCGRWNYLDILEIIYISGKDDNSDEFVFYFVESNFSFGKV